MPGNAEGSFTIGTTAAQVVGASPSRTGIRFWPPANNRVTISNNPNPVIDGRMTLQQGQAPMVFSGEAAKRPWFAIANVAGVQVGFDEVYD